MEMEQDQNRLHPDERLWLYVLAAVVSLSILVVSGYIFAAALLEAEWLRAALSGAACLAGSAATLFLMVRVVRLVAFDDESPFQG